MRAAQGGIAVAGAASWLDNLRFPTSSTAVKPDVASGFVGVRTFAWSTTNPEVIPHAPNLAQEPHPRRGGRRRRAETPPRPSRPPARPAVLVTGTSATSST